MQNIYKDLESQDFLPKKGTHIRVMCDYLLTKDNPVILEFGVERGGSTRAFAKLIDKITGKLYSVDINDCSNVCNSVNWRFLQSDDLDIDYVLKNFEEIKNSGVDLIYIDSYHENFHVQKLLEIYFKYVKKNGAIFVDDIDSFPFRQKKDIWNSIVYDLTDYSVKEFYYNNINKASYRIYYDEGENGLGKIIKKTEFNDEPNLTKKIWNYNIIIKLFYPYLRKIKKFFSRT